MFEPALPYIYQEHFIKETNDLSTILDWKKNINTESLSKTIYNILELWEMNSSSHKLLFWYVEHEMVMFVTIL